MYSSGPWTLPKMCVQLFSKMDPATEAYEYMSALTMGWGSAPFSIPKKPSCACVGRKGFSPLEWTPYLLAELSFSTSFVLGVSE